MQQRAAAAAGMPWSSAADTVAAVAAAAAQPAAAAAATFCACRAAQAAPAHAHSIQRTCAACASRATGPVGRRALHTSAATPAASRFAVPPPLLQTLQRRGLHSMHRAQIPLGVPLRASAVSLIAGSKQPFALVPRMWMSTAGASGQQQQQQQAEGESEDRFHGRKDGEEGARFEGEAGAGGAAGEAGAEGAEGDAKPKKPFNWKKLFAWLAGLTVLGAGATVSFREMISMSASGSVLASLRTGKLDALSLPGTSDSWLQSPVLLFSQTNILSVLLTEDEWLTHIVPLLSPPGVATGPLGASAGEIEVEAVARINALLGVLVYANQMAPDAMQERLRHAHRLSALNAQHVKDHFAELEVMRYEMAVAAREKETKAQLEELEQSFLSSRASPEKQAEEKAALLARRSRLPPIDPPRTTYKAEDIPLTLMQALVRHGLHRLPKESAEDYEAVWVTRRRIKLAQERALKRRLDGLPDPVTESERTAELSAIDEVIKHEVPHKRAMFRSMVSEQTEQNLVIQAWTLLKCMVEPAISPSGPSQFVLGGDLASVLPDPLVLRSTGKKVLEKTEEEKRELRRELVQEHLRIFAVFLRPPEPGVVPIWGAEGIGPAQELIGTLLFDIPPLAGQSFSEPMRQALYQVFVGLATQYMEHHAPGAAVKCLRHVLELEPNNPLYLTQLATELVKLGQARQSRDAYEQALEAHEELDADELARYASAVVDEAANPCIPEAMERLREALRADPLNLDASYHFLRLHLTLGGADAAAKVLTPVVNGLIKSIRAAPTFKETPGLSGQAGDVFEEPNPMLAPSYNVVIRTLERLGRTDEAVEMAREWSYRHSLNAVAHFSLGRVLLRHERDAREAEAALLTALDLDPTRSETLYQMSLAQLRLGNLTEARKRAEAALSAQAKVEARVRTNVHMEQATATSSLRRDRQDVLDRTFGPFMDRVLSQPGAEKLPIEEVRKQAADLYAREQAAKGKTGALRQLVEPPSEFIVHNPVAGAHLVLAQVAAKRGDLHEALRQSRTFVSQRPLSTEGFILQAQLYQQQGDMLEAYAALSRVARLWRRRVLHNAAQQSGGSLFGKDGKVAVAKVDKARKAYFDARPKEAALLKSLEQSCAVAQQAAQAYAQAMAAAPGTPAAQLPTGETLTQAQLTKVPEFQDLCTQLDRLRAGSAAK